MWSQALDPAAVGPRASCLPCLDPSLLICAVGAALPVQPEKAGVRTGGDAKHLEPSGIAGAVEAQTDH